MVSWQFAAARIMQTVWHFRHDFHLCGTFRLRVLLKLGHEIFGQFAIVIVAQGAVVHHTESGKTAAMRFEQRSRNDFAVFLNAKVFHFDSLAGTQTACGRGLLEVAVRVMRGKIVKRLRTQRNQRKCSHMIMPFVVRLSKSIAVRNRSDDSTQRIHQKHLPTQSNSLFTLDHFLNAVGFSPCNMFCHVFSYKKSPRWLHCGLLMVLTVHYSKDELVEIHRRDSTHRAPGGDASEDYVRQKTEAVRGR